MSYTAKFDDFQRKIFSAIEVMKSNVGVRDYPEYILPLLFLKYISDAYRQHEKEDFEDNDDHTAWLKKRLKKIFSREQLCSCDYYSLYDSRHNGNLGRLMNETFHRLEEAYSNDLKNVFSLVDFNSYRLGDNSERSSILCELLEAISKISFEEKLSESYLYQKSDLFSIAAEILLSQIKYSSSIAPIEVCRLVAKLLSPQKAERVYDPAFSTGSLLIACATEDRVKVDDVPRVFGVERNGIAWSLARMNAFLNCENGSGMHIGRFATKSRRELNDSYDVAVSFPPFGSKDSLFPALPWGMSYDFLPNPDSKLSTEYSAILHMLSVLEDGHGRLALILPSGSLSKSGTEKFVRQRLIEYNLVDAVIGLPERLIAGVAARFSIIILRKDRVGKEVLFLDITSQNSALRGQIRLSEKQALDIIEAYNNFKEKSISEHSIAIEEIEVNDFNFNSSVFSKNTTAVEQVDLNLLQEQREVIKRRLEKLDEEINDEIEAAGLRQVV